MSIEEFWEKNPDLFWAYRFSYYRKDREKKYNIWLQGRYVYEAVSVALSNAFSKQQFHYPRLPYGEEINKEQHVSSLLETKLRTRVLEVQKVMEKKDE